MNNADAIKEWEFQHILYEEQMIKKAAEEDADPRMNAYLPVLDSNKERIREKWSAVEDLIKPTHDQITVPEIQKELKDRIYEKSVTVIDDLDKCLNESRDFFDQDKCVAKFESRIDNDVLPFVFRTVREY